MSFGLPLVTTPIGAEGINLTNQYNAMIASNSTEFAQAILTLYNQQDLWLKFSQNSLDEAKQFSPQQIQPKLNGLFNSL